jgi:hypothetical protein
MRAVRTLSDLQGPQTFLLHAHTRPQTARPIAAEKFEEDEEDD